MEEIEQAKELQMEGKMRRDEIDALLDDDDEELKEELDRIEAGMMQENFNNANINLGVNQNQNLNTNMNQNQTYNTYIATNKQLRKSSISQNRRLAYG